MKKRLKDRAHLMLSIKDENRVIGFDHIYEKVSRDAGGATEEEVENALEELAKENYIKKTEEGWQITEYGRGKAEPLAKDLDMNLSYRQVYIARRYYSEMGKYILPFLRDRNIAVIKLFSNEEKPTDRVKKVFSRFSKRTPPKPHRIENKGELMRYVNMHTVEFLIISEKGKNPDFLGLTVKPGKKAKKNEEERKLLRKITRITYNIMVEEANLNPFITFSGVEGFNIFSKFTKPLGDRKVYQRASRVIKKLVEKRIKDERTDTPPAASQILSLENEKGMINFSPQGVRPNSTVIAPYSLHWKTGLASIPIRPSHLEEFQPEDAKPEMVIKQKEKLDGIIEEKATSPMKLAKALDLGLFSYF